MSGVPAAFYPPSVAAYAAGVSPVPAAPAPAAEGGGVSFATMVAAGIAATALVLWVQGRMRENEERDECERLLDEATRAQRELDDHREDLSIAHDWTTSHPLAVRYGQ